MDFSYIKKSILHENVNCHSCSNEIMLYYNTNIYNSYLESNKKKKIYCKDCREKHLNYKKLLEKYDYLELKYKKLLDSNKELLTSKNKYKKLYKELEDKNSELEIVNNKLEEYNNDIILLNNDLQKSYEEIKKVNVNFQESFEKTTNENIKLVNEIKRLNDLIQISNSSGGSRSLNFNKYSISNSDYINYGYRNSLSIQPPFQSQFPLPLPSLSSLFSYNVSAGASLDISPGANLNIIPFPELDPSANFHSSINYSSSKYIDNLYHPYSLYNTENLGLKSLKRLREN